MRTIALIEEPNHVCFRYRLEAYASEFARRGGRLEPQPIERNLFSRLAQFRRVAGADAVILQRKLLPVWQLALLRRCARRLVYDFDDALFLRDSYSPKGVDSRARLMRFWATVYAADSVIAGNRFLAAQADRFVEPGRVQVIPTSIDPAHYRMASHDGDPRRVRLAWIGQPATLHGLCRAEAQLTAAAARTPGLELHVICSEFPRFKGIHVVDRPWSSDREADDLAAADVGVSWLPDDPWSQGKCGLKVLQYMAAGLPVVANPVGLQCDLVRHGETGFLAETPDQWAEAIARLAADAPLRRRLGAAGRRLVEQHYSVERSAQRFTDLLLSAVQGDDALRRSPLLRPASRLLPWNRPAVGRRADRDRRPESVGGQVL